MGNNKIRNKKNLKEIRQTLRHNLTPAEAKLWKALKNKKLEGKKFRRQYSIYNIIVDFYCPESQLAIELDGNYHFEAYGMERDQDKAKTLDANGVKLLRFENKLVCEQFDIVIEKIRENL